MTIAIRLRRTEEKDLDTFFLHQCDPLAAQMAAFTSTDPANREAFNERWHRLLNDDTILTRTIVIDNRIAGHVSCFEREKSREVTYWLGREFWGRGFATVALGEMMRQVSERPVYARAASDNVATIRVLEKCGFERCGEGRGFAAARNSEIDEVVMRLGD